MSNQSRYEICKQTLLTNIEYARQKQINIVICLFDDTARLYTNIKINKIFDEEDGLRNKYSIYDSLTYDQIIAEINQSQPMAGTDFMVPFELLSNIKEINENSEIFFLSDGQNCRPFSDTDMEFLGTYKTRVTTLGIGPKESYDETTLSKMSKNNETLEGESAEIIQQELLAQMSDMTDVVTDTWKNVEITIMGDISTLKIGSMMNVTPISKEEYESANFINTIHNPNLILSKTSNNNYMINKINNISLSEPTNNIDTLIFIVDQSGSMRSRSYANRHRSNSTDTIIEPTQSEQQEQDLVLDHVKYTMQLPYLKAYQRIIFSSEDNNFKAKITWLDNENKTQTMILHDVSKYTMINDPVVEQTIQIANELGYYINIANIADKEDTIGYFRNINQICKTHRKFLDDVLENNLLSDFSLMELLFYNKKHGMKLYFSTLTRSERNMKQLLSQTSAGGGYKMFAASATMSIACNVTPSSQVHHEEQNQNINKDISMCTICYDEIREYIFSCGHCYSCKSCAEKLLASSPMNTCSYCNYTVTWIRKITLTDDQKNPEHYFKCITEKCFNIASIVAKCPETPDDSGHHLTYCAKCFKNGKKEYKKLKISKSCFCGKEINKIMDNVYFS